MKFVVALAVAALLNGAYGATYEQNHQVPGGEEHIDENQRVIFQHDPVPDLPDSASTISEKLVYNGKPSTKRTVDVTKLQTTQAAVQASLVTFHNKIRKEVSPASSFLMSWDNEVSQKAQKWADRCEFRHPTSSSEQSDYMTTPKNKLGQNIAMGTGDMSWDSALKMWYDEKKDFVFGRDTGKVVGHYTAMVWKTTNKVGCGYKLCKQGTPDQFHYFVCDYAPAGNVYPNHLKPYEAGKACGKCPNACKDSLCTNPCQYTNGLSNCEESSGSYPALFPNGCASGGSGMDQMKEQCKATCNCKGKSLY